MFSYVGYPWHAPTGLQILPVSEIKSMKDFEKIAWNSMEPFCQENQKLHGPEQNSVELHATSVYVA